jgi:hypothetical protein
VLLLVLLLFLLCFLVVDWGGRSDSGKGGEMEYCAEAGLRRVWGGEDVGIGMPLVGEVVRGTAVGGLCEEEVVRRKLLVVGVIGAEVVEVEEGEVEEGVSR